MWSRATIHATRNLRTGRNARPALSRFYLDVSKRSKRKNAANPIGRGGSIDATFGSSSFPFFITAPTDLSRVYLTTIARTDDYNSTINFASRKILFLSFFDRLRSTCLFFSFFPPSRPLLLSHCPPNEKFILPPLTDCSSLLFSRSFVERKKSFYARSLCRCIDSSLSSSVFSIIFSRSKKKEKRRKGSKIHHRVVVNVSCGFLFSFIPREIILIISSWNGSWRCTSRNSASI